MGQQLVAAGADCAEIEVPLDYRRPEGRTISLAVSRLRAEDEANRIGVLVLNDGGPGVPGLLMPVRKREALGLAAERYDLIGLDPRFTGRSTPIDCAWSTSLHMRSAGTPGEFAAGLRLSRSLADSCVRRHADVLQYATTANTARDMDRLRIALGERTLHYLGYSYGSYLGAVYLQLFGQHAGRFVLDGPVDPDRFGPELIRDTGRANESALRDWAAWAADHNSTYRLGRTTAEVVAAVRKLIRDAGRRLIPIGGHEVDATLIPVMLWMLLPDDRPAANAVLARVVADLRSAARGAPADPDPVLLALASFLRTGEESAIASALVAITCADRAAPRDPRTYWTDIRRHRATEPVFGPLLRNITPCAYWPRPLAEAVVVRNTHPALLITATRDTRATWHQALALRRALPASRLLTINARKHGLYGEYGNLCIDHAATNYLLTATLPTTDSTCTTGSTQPAGTVGHGQGGSGDQPDSSQGAESRD